MQRAPLLSWHRRLANGETSSVDARPSRMGGAALIRRDGEGDESLRARLRKTYEPVHIEVKGSRDAQRQSHPGASRHGIPT